MRRTLIALAALVPTTSPALAQYPPPGIYACTIAPNAPVGTLVLMTLGDYQFTVDGKPDDPGNGNGQLASSGNVISPVSGPFHDVYTATGSFETDTAGVTVLTFTRADGSVMTCAVPAG
jgi:hypothetical protein